MRTTVVPSPLHDDVAAAGCRTLTDVFRLRAEEGAARVVYRFVQASDAPDATLTFGALDRRARAIAARLRTVVEPGDRALLLFPPSLEYIEAFVACLYAGVVAVPAYPPHARRPDARVPGIVADCGALIALGTAAALERLEGWRGREPALAPLAWLATDQVTDADAASWAPPPVDATSLALLQYTSGSTGTPKGVMLTHAHLLHNLAAVHASFAHRDGDHGVFWLPPFHDMGLMGAILQPAYAGLSTALMSPAAFLQRPMAWLEEIARRRATTSGAPNFAYDLCVDRSTPEERAALDLSSWRTAFSGAEPVRAATLRRFAAAFAPAGFDPSAFLPCYGLAEATLIVTGRRRAERPTVLDVSRRALERGCVAPGGGDDDVGLVSSGAAVADMEVRIVDPERRAAVGEGRVGEVWVSGGSVGAGYWGRPDDPAFGNRLPDDDRAWLRTGDLGALVGGELFVTGRARDLIILAGRNVHPPDVEAAAERAHAALRAGHAAAFAVERDGRERLVVALEVSRHMEPGDEAAVFGAVRDAVAREVGVLVDEVVLLRQGTIPRTSSGKIRRGATRDALADGTLAPAAREGDAPGPPANREDAPASVRAWLERWCRTELGVSPDELRPDATLRDVGLESLDAVRLVVAAERELGVRVHAEALWAAGDVAGVVALLEGAAPDARRATVASDPFELPGEAELEARLALLDEAGLAVPFFVEHEGVASATTTVAGRTLDNFGSYDYLGLAGHPAVVEGAVDALRRWGTSVSASRVISGERPVHGMLERELAAFLGVEATLAFVSGHATNVSAIGRLVGEGDLVVADALAHDSIVQGARLSGARRLVFPHGDHEALDAMLRDLRGRYRRVLVAIEGVYSADGDAPDLARFVEVKRRHEALLLVDEAHSLGVLGATGRGLCEHAGVSPADVDVHMGTLSKALVSCGGYVGGSARVVRWLRHTAPGFVFSVGMSPANAGAALAALGVLRAEPARAARLRENAGHFLHLLRDGGVDTGHASGSGVVPVMAGDSLRAIRLSHALLARGVSAPPMVAPAVPDGAARVRFFLSAAHERPQLERAARAVVESLRALDA